MELLKIPVNEEMNIKKWNVYYSIEPIYNKKREIINEEEYINSRQAVLKDTEKTYIINNKEYFDIKVEIETTNPHRRCVCFNWNNDDGSCSYCEWEEEHSEETNE